MIKKAVSLTLAVLMITGVFACGVPGIVAFADNSGRIVSSGWDDIQIAVPETVYVTPVNNYNSTSTSVSYYVNNVIDPTGSYSLDRINNADKGKFYIYSSHIESVKTVSVDGASLSNFSAAQYGNDLFMDDSFTLTLSSGISSSQTKTLEWSITCKMTDGTTAIFYAYTVAYAPYLSPIFAAGRCKNTRGSNSFGSGLSWVSGIHGISTGGGYYPYNNFLPLLGGPTQGDGTTGPDSWFNGSQQCGLPAKGGWYTSKEYGYNYGDETLCVFERSAEGYINVDTSRYNNLNQIPNLTCGIYVTDNEGAGTVWGYIGKLNNWSDRIQSGRNWYTRSTTNPSEYDASVDIYGGDRWTNRGGNWAIRGQTMNSAIPSGWVAFRGAFGTDGNGDRCFCILDNYLNFIQVDKSSWRSAINDAQKFGFQSGWFTSATDFNNWKDSLKSVYEAVGNPTNSTAPDLNTFTSRTATLKTEYSGTESAALTNDFGVVKVLDANGNFNNQYKVINLPGFSNPGETETIKAGYAVSLSREFVNGNYTYKGNLLQKNEKTAGETFTNADFNTGLGLINTQDAVSYTHITQTQITNGEHRRTFYYLGKDKTVDIDPNGGVWNGSKNTSTVTGSYKTEWSPAQPTRKDFLFIGWEHTQGGDSALSDSTFTFGSSSATLRAKWIKSNAVYVVDNGAALQFAPCTDDESGTTLSSVSAPSDSKFETEKIGSNVEFRIKPSSGTSTPQMLTAPVTFSCVKNYNSKSYTETITVIPATSVYYEETFVNCTGEWENLGSEQTVTAAAGIEAVYGECKPYDTANSTSYSLGTAKKATVSKTNKSGPYAEFTFTGTGFDVYSMTDSDSGVIVYTISDSNGETVTTSFINTYLGYSYGPLFMEVEDGVNKAITLENTGHPVYYTDSTANGTFFIGDYNVAHASSRGTTNSSLGTDQAYGWVMTNSGSVYQVPVISKTGLDYGTYTVKLEPKYSAMQSGGRDSYSFILDSIRIYDPIDPKNGDATANNKYKEDIEYAPHYQTVRDILINMPDFIDGSNGIALLDSKGGTVTLDDYKNFGPAGETYLNPGQAIAFNITTSNIKPEKLAIGVRVVQGSSGTITVNGNTINVYGATEIYRNITDYAPLTLQGGVYKSNNPVVIANTSGSGVMISLTKIRWSYSEINGKALSNARQLMFTFDEPSLLACQSMMSTIFNPVITADSTGITAKWDKENIALGEKATLTIAADENYTKAFVDGGEIAGYSEEEGVRTWTYTFSGTEIGENAFDVKLQDVNGYMTSSIKTANVKVVAPTVNINDATITWSKETVKSGDKATLTVKAPANIVKVSVGKTDITSFTTLDSGEKQFTYELTTSTAGEYKYTVILTETYGYTSANGETPVLTVEPVTPATQPEENNGNQGDNNTPGENENNEEQPEEENLTFFQKIIRFLKGLFDSIMKLFGKAGI